MFRNTTKDFRQRIDREYRWVGTAETQLPAIYVDLYGNARGTRYFKRILDREGFWDRKGFVRADCIDRRACDDPIDPAIVAKAENIHSHSS